MTFHIRKDGQAQRSIPSMIKMKIHRQLTASDYIRSQYLHLRPRPVIGWIGLLLVLGALALAIQQILVPPSGKISWGPWAILGCMAYFAITYGIFLPLRAKKIFTQQKTLHEPFEVDLTNEALSSTSTYGSFCMPWSQFHKYKTNKDMILVYQSAVLYHIFPKRWFTDSQLTEFLSILQKHLGHPKP